MRIGVDARCLSGDLTGIGRYLWEILLCVEADISSVEIFLYSRSPVGVELASVRWHQRVDTHPLWRRLPGVIWVKARLPSLVRRDRLDVFWAVTTLSPRVDVPVVATVHDLNPLLVPETMPIVNRLAYRCWFKRDIRRATRLVANSYGTASRVRAMLGCSVDAVAIPGARWAAMEGGGKESGRVVDGPYILAVGTREPRKNLSSLVEAFARLRAKGLVQRHRLVLVGAKGWGRAPTSSRSTVPEWLIELGYVSDDLMASLFVNADVFVQPSIYEGFGMPAAEAASFGTPVVATDIPELREAAGPDGIFVNSDPDSLAAGIMTALTAPRPRRYPGHSWKEAGGVMALVLTRASRER